MRLLILGGTVFLGRHLVEAAVAHGHDVTIFTRGVHNPDIFPDVEQLRGDRLSDLSALEGRQWDATIDTSGYIPRAVRASAELLAPNVAHYTFISTESVYADVSRPGVNETGSLATLSGSPERRSGPQKPDESVEEITAETYGPLKVLCERAAEEAMPGRVLTIRPGLIVGPYDPSDRFTYWPRRVAEGGEVLAPGRPERPVQFIDVRDLAAWNLAMVEEERTGTYNADSPAGAITMGSMLDACRRVAGSDARFVWLDEAFLLEQGVGPWMELPLWLPESGEYAGMLDMDISKATAAGLTMRPVEETARDTLAWDRTRSERNPAAGMKPEREAELLTKWKAARAG